MRCLFLDRDGTINVDKGYSNKVEELKIIGDLRESLYRVKKLGFYVVVVSNQAGVSLGYHTLEDVLNFNREIQRELGGIIDEFFVCPHPKEGGCGCRKPEAGLIKMACEKFKIDLHLSWVVGDKSTDIELAKNVGCRSILVLTGHGKEEYVKSYPDFVAEDINHAIRIIENEVKDEIIPVCGQIEPVKKSVYGVIDMKLSGKFKKWRGKLRVNIVPFRDNIGFQSTDDFYYDESDFEEVPDLPTDFIIGVEERGKIG